MTPTQVRITDHEIHALFITTRCRPTIGDTFTFDARTWTINTITPHHHHAGPAIIATATRTNQ